MSIVSDELIKLGGGADSYKGMKLISPDNVNQKDYLNNIQADKYDIYANNIHYTLSNIGISNWRKNTFYIFNIFNLHDPLKNNAYSKWPNPLYITIDLNKPIKGICKLEIFPDRIINYDNKYCPGFRTYRIYTYYDNNNSYEDSGDLYYDYSQSYIYNDIAKCYQPQIINFDSTKRIHRIDLFILNPVQGSSEGNPYNKISYVKIYQRTVDSYLILFLSDNNLYEYNEDKTYTKILSLEEWNNKTESEKKELLSKIQSPYTIKEIDKNILNKFKIIKFNNEN